MMADKILEVEVGTYDKPEPSLCDNCQFAQEVSGGFVSIGWIKTYKHRYCSYPPLTEKTGGRNISLSGFAECEHCRKNNATPNRS